MHFYITHLLIWQLFSWRGTVDFSVAKMVSKAGILDKLIQMAGNEKPISLVDKRGFIHCGNRISLYGFPYPKNASAFWGIKKKSRRGPGFLFLKVRDFVTTKSRLRKEARENLFKSNRAPL